MKRNFPWQRRPVRNGGGPSRLFPLYGKTWNVCGIFLSMRTVLVFSMVFVRTTWFAVMKITGTRNAEVATFLLSTGNYIGNSFEAAMRCAWNPAGSCRNFPSDTDIVDRLRYVGTITAYYLFSLIRRVGRKVSMKIRINNTMVARWFPIKWIPLSVPLANSLAAPADARATEITERDRRNGAVFNVGEKYLTGSLIRVDTCNYFSFLVFSPSFVIDSSTGNYD